MTWFRPSTHKDPSPRPPINRGLSKAMRLVALDRARAAGHSMSRMVPDTNVSMVGECNVCGELLAYDWKALETMGGALRAPCNERVTM